MDEQGCSVLTVDEKVVLDRIGLESAITSERIRQALEATGRVGRGSRRKPDVFALIHVGLTPRRSP
jgi:hypothetical protein